MDLRELEHCGLKRISTKREAMTPKERLDELIHADPEERNQIMLEHIGRKRGIAAMKFAQENLKKLKTTSPPSPPEAIVDKKVSPENIHFSNLFENEIESASTIPIILPITDAVICLECGDEFGDIMELDSHIKNHLLQGNQLKHELLVVKKEKIKVEGRATRSRTQKPFIGPVNVNNIKVEDIPLNSTLRPMIEGRLFYKCMMCGKRMNTEEVLQNHLLKYHPVKKEEPETTHTTQPCYENSDRFLCEFCVRSYKRKQTLRSHIKKEHPQHYIPERRGRKN